MAIRSSPTNPPIRINCLSAPSPPPILQGNCTKKSLKRLSRLIQLKHAVQCAMCMMGRGEGGGAGSSASAQTKWGHSHPLLVQKVKNTTIIFGLSLVSLCCIALHCDPPPSPTESQKEMPFSNLEPLPAQNVELTANHLQ